MAPTTRKRTAPVGEPVKAADAAHQPLNSEHLYVKANQPHMERRKALQAKYGKEIAKLAGARPVSFIYVLLIIAMQVAGAYLVHKYDAPWYVILGAAYILGAVVDHAMWVLIHDLTHNSVFKSTFLTNVGQVIANIPLIAPSAISFMYFHKEHHGHLNETYDDPDLPGELENKIFGGSAIGKATWLLFFPIVQSIRTIRYSPRWGSLMYWNILNWIVQMSANVAAVQYFGWNGFAYLGLSSCFAIGLHPLGARWIAEHYSTHPPQETYSYYGGFNKIMFNVGYHNEHHDIMAIPWMNLPKLRALAPEFYNNLAEHDSYWRLLFQFIFDPAFTLHTRVVRQPGQGWQ